MSLRRPSREELAAAVIAPVVIAAAAFAWIQRNAAASETMPPKLDAAIAADSARIAGQLSNHLKYYIRPNNWPDNRIELRLVVNAGSVLETATQHGLAHAVEHMVFRGTKNFPGRAVDDYLTSIGMRPGDDVNASTNADETIYSITVPANRAGAADTALRIFADMAGQATFDAAEARQEAGIVMEEWRMRSDAERRLSDARNRTLLTGSPYADHVTIGDTATLRRFDLAEMRRFYADWYRPDLMAVVVVGAVDPRLIENRIRSLFAEMRPRGATTPRPAIRVPSVGHARAMAMYDPETARPRLTLWHVDSALVTRTLAEYRRFLVRQVGQDIVNDRLDDVCEQPGSPILDSYTGVQSPARSMGASYVSVQPANGKEPAAFDTLVASLARLAAFPVSVGELHQHTSAILSQRRSAEEWSDNSSDLADDLVDEYLTGSIALTRTRRYELARDLLPTITPADVQAWAREAIADRGMLATTIRRERSDTTGVADDLLARIRAGKAAPTSQALRASARVALMSEPPQPGKVVAETTLADSRVYDWRLSNGMRVILKPTSFTFDEIDFRLFAPGGASLASDADYPSAYFADHVVLRTGIGTVNGRELGRRLDETSIELSPSVSDDEIRFTGNTAPRDLDFLFQVLHEYLTAPRSDSAAFRRYQEQRANSTENRAGNPDIVFSDSVAAIVAQHHPRALHNIERTSRSIDMSKALAFWRDRMSNGSNFTLVMVGDFTLSRARGLVERYLASVPSGTLEKPRSSHGAFPAGIVRREFPLGAGPRSRTMIALSGKYDGTAEASDQLSMATDLSEMVLGERLRERMGGTYGVNVSWSVDLVPPARYQVTIEFEAAPNRIGELTDAALAELRRLREAGPTQSEYEKIHATRMRDREGEEKRNSYWASELATHARMGWPLAAIANHELEVKMLSRRTLQTAASNYLNASQYVQVTMVPRSANRR